MFSIKVEISAGRSEEGRQRWNRWETTCKLSHEFYYWFFSSIFLLIHVRALENWLTRRAQDERKKVLWIDTNEFAFEIKAQIEKRNKRAERSFLCDLKLDPRFAYKFPSFLLCFAFVASGPDATRSGRGE